MAEKKEKDDDELEDDDDKTKTRDDNPDDDFDEDFDKDFDDDDDDDDDEDDSEEYEPEPDSYDTFKQTDDEAPPSMVLKLEVGEEVTGRLVRIEKQTNTDSKGNTITSKLYHILSPGETETWRIYGTTVLDQWMARKEEGDRLGIVRDADKPAKIAGRQPTQMYHTYTIVKRKKKKHSQEKKRHQEKKHHPERERRTEKKPKKKHHEDEDEDED